MASILVDSNIILDVVTVDKNWCRWSSDMLAELGEHSTLIINPIIYGEISISYESIELLDSVLSPQRFKRESIPFEACFLAAKVFVKYKKNKGEYKAILPDFLIGAHASVQGYRLITRDVSRYQTYYPKLKLIYPQKH